MIPIVDKCCCCISLRTGSILIGILIFINSVLSLRTPLMILKYLVDHGDEVEKDEKTRIFIKIYVAISIIFGFLLAVTGICIIYAAWKYIPKLIKWSALFVLANAIVVLLIALRYFYVKRNVPQFGIDSLIFVIYLYFVLVLWSFYQEMMDYEEEEEEEDEWDYL